MFEIELNTTVTEELTWRNKTKIRIGYWGVSQGISADDAEYVTGKLLREPPICTNETSTLNAPFDQTTEFTINFVDPLLLNDENSAIISPSGL